MLASRPKPCDPYTELEYFHTIARMVDCVEKNVADLVLMGIYFYYCLISV